MENKFIKKCAKCNQQLRIPTNIGGMVMVCPSCGHKFHSDFKLSADSGEKNRLEKDRLTQPQGIAPGSTFRIIV